MTGVELPDEPFQVAVYIASALGETEVQPKVMLKIWSDSPPAAKAQRAQFSTTVGAGAAPRRVKGSE